MFDLFDYISPPIFAGLIVVLTIFGIVYAEIIHRKFGICISLKIRKVATHKSDTPIYSLRIRNKANNTIIIKYAGLFSSQTQQRSKHSFDTTFFRYHDDFIIQNNSFPITIEAKSFEDIHFCRTSHIKGIFIEVYKTSYNDYDYSISDNSKGHYLRMNRADEIRKAPDGKPFLRVYKSCSLFF